MSRRPKLFPGQMREIRRFGAMHKAITQLYRQLSVRGLMKIYGVTAPVIQFALNGKQHRSYSRSSHDPGSNPPMSQISDAEATRALEDWILERIAATEEGRQRLVEHAFKPIREDQCALMQRSSGFSSPE